jgi:molybdopterin-guanine dinucleotide biosynthesis protein A
MKLERFLAEPPRIPTLLVARSESGVHPVVGMWTVEIAPELAKALAEGKRKVGDWTRQQKAVEVVFPAAVIGGREVDPLFNINRPEDLAEAEALLKTR